MSAGRTVFAQLIEHLPHKGNQQWVTGKICVTFSTDTTSTQNCVIKLEVRQSPRVSYSGTRDQNGGFGFDRCIHKEWWPEQRILAETGIRGGEICGLRIDDLDLDHRVIHVMQSVWRGQLRTVKSRKGNRRLPISPELVEQLRGFLRTWRPNTLGLLFATRKSTPRDNSLIRKRKFHPLLK